MNRILLVEDDPSIVVFLEEFLTGEGFCVKHAAGEREAVRVLSEPFDLLLVDISLKQGNGFSVCKAARDKGLPVIFLTADSEENSVVKGLDMGADDYVSKPFRPRELLSRIKSVLRRYGRDSSSVITIGDVTVDTDRAVVLKGGKEIGLSALEYRLFMVFVNNRGILLSRTRLLEDIWDIAGDYVNDNTLTVYMKRLRAKIEDDPSAPSLIRTVRGLGYRMD